MDFSYFNLDILSSDAAEVEKVNLNIFFFLYAVINAYCDDISYFIHARCKLLFVLASILHIFTCI